MPARTPAACLLFLLFEVAIGGCKSAATTAADGSDGLAEVGGNGGGGGSGGSAGSASGGTGGLADSGAGGIGDSGLPMNADANRSPGDATAPQDSGPLSCAQRLADLGTKLMSALTCQPQNASSCKGTVEGICGCPQVVGDPSSVAAMVYSDAVRAFKSAGCVAPCPDAGGCPPATGSCASPGQEQRFSCSY